MFVCASECMCDWHFDHSSWALFISIVLKSLFIGPDLT